MSRLTLTILAAAGITLITGASFWFSAFGQSGGSMVPADTRQVATYSDYYYDFSFDYTVDLSITVDDDRSSGHVIFGDRPDGSFAFMVALESYNSDAPLREESIRSELDPDTVVTPTTIAEGIPALTFRQNSGPLGEIRATLFVHRGQLYQILMAADLEDQLRLILDTFEFLSPPA